MASLYPQEPQRSATQVWSGQVGELSASTIEVSTPYGTTSSALSTGMYGAYPAGTSALVLRAGGDNQRPMVLGQSGYAVP